MAEALKAAQKIAAQSSPAAHDGEGGGEPGL